MKKLILSLVLSGLTSTSFANITRDSILQTTYVQDGVKYTQNYKVYRSQGVNRFYINGSKVGCIGGNLFILRSSATLVPNMKCKIIKMF